MEILHLLVVKLMKHFFWNMFMLTCDDRVPGCLEFFDVVSFSLDALELQESIPTLPSGTSIVILVYHP